MIDNCEIHCRLCFVREFTYFPRGYLKFLVVLIGIVLIFKDQITDLVYDIFHTIFEQAGDV